MSEKTAAAEALVTGRVPAGYSTRTLPEKLGVPGAGSSALALYPPDGYDVGIPTAGRIPDSPARSFRFLHGFYADRLRMETEVDRLAELLHRDGVLWISWPKRSSGVRTNLDDNVLRTVLLPRGLVDIKVCAIDATWSGLKFVYRKELRKAP